MHVKGGRGGLESVCVQGTGACFGLEAPSFLYLSQEGTGCALHPLGLPCSESKVDD